MKRVLIVDDSSFMRKSLTHLLESDDTIEVVDTAADGADAVRKVRQLRPDVVILDIEMSGMDGLAALAHIMAECPTPVLVLSGLGKNDATLALKCLEQGAVDFIPNPPASSRMTSTRLRAEIIAKVKWAAGVPVRKLDLRLRGEPLRRAGRRPAKRDKIVVIGASTGGPRALATILSSLPPALAAAVLVVQHMSPAFVPSFADRLKWECLLDVAVARQDEALTPGRVVIAPGGCHTLIEHSGRRQADPLEQEGVAPRHFPLRRLCHGIRRRGLRRRGHRRPVDGDGQRRRPAA